MCVMGKDADRPIVSVWRSEEDTHWTVQIDSTVSIGLVAVDLNDGRLFYGDPEQFDPIVAAQAVLEASGEHPSSSHHPGPGRRGSGGCSAVLSRSVTAVAG